MTDQDPSPTDRIEAELAAPSGETAAPHPEFTHVKHSLVGLVGYLPAGQDAEVANSLAGAVVAGRDLAASDSACNIAVAGNNIDLTHSRAGLVIAGNRIQVQASSIGLLLAGSNTTLNNSTILLTTRQAVALGAALGAAFALGSALLRRPKRPPN